MSALALNPAAPRKQRPRLYVQIRLSLLNISKHEQRTLHALAQGGAIHHYKNNKGDIIEIDCVNRDGWRLGDCTLSVFRKLRRRGFIMSREGGPYRITRLGLEAVRAQLDNR